MRLQVMTLLTCAATASCEWYTGSGEGALRGEPLNPIRPEAIGGGDCGGASGDVLADPGVLNVKDLSGLGWEFDTLKLTVPLTGQVAGMVNDFLATEIGEGRLVLLLVADKDDRGSGELALSVGAGKEEGGAYSFPGKKSGVKCTLTGATFVTIEPAVLEIPLAVFEPPRLPLRDVYLTGRFSADGAAITDGGLEGALTREDAKGTAMLGTDLDTQLTTVFGIPPDMDMDKDGTADAWRFGGTFTAVRVKVGKEGQR